MRVHAARIPPWLVDRLKHPITVTAAMALGIKFGQETSRLRDGRIDPEEFQRRAGAHLGSITGTVMGALIGTVAGAWLPGVGTFAGAFTGAMVGESAGQRLGRAGAERVRKKHAQLADAEAPALPDRPKRSL